MRVLEVRRPGLGTTIQDLGRRGCVELGIPTGGAADVYSHRLANAVLGNEPSAATLEMMLLGASFDVLAATTLAALARYHWPGNVRELQNVLASLAVRCGRRGVVGPSALPPHLAQGSAAAADKWRLDEARRTFDERFVRAALVRSGGHRGRAAEELGVTRQGLTKLMARLGISSSSPAGDTG